LFTEDKQNKKGFFAKLCEFFKGFEGSGCACNCLKTVWVKYAQEEANKDNQEKSNPQKH
jgi:hypothetical protein